MNRILTAVNSTADVIANSGLSQSKLDNLNSTMDIEMFELVRWQEAKSIAVAEGVLTTEEGVYIYHQLGGTPSVFNGRPLAVKVAITKTMGELLSVPV